jgi:hypothetical protein
VEDQATLVERGAQGRVLRVEAVSATALASARKEAKGLVWKIALLEGELTEAGRAREVAKENSRDLSDAAADIERQQEESERERQE